MAGLTRKELAKMYLEDHLLRLSNLKRCNITQLSHDIQIEYPNCENQQEITYRLELQYSRNIGRFFCPDYVKVDEEEVNEDSFDEETGEKFDPVIYDV